MVTVAVAVVVFLTLSASTVALRPLSKLHAALSPADEDVPLLPGIRFATAKVTRAVPVTVTVEGVGAGGAVTVAAADAQHCTLSLHGAGEGGVSVANLAVELRACAALKAALGLDAASTGLDAFVAAWVHDVTVAGIDAPYAHDGNVAGVADGTAITVRIRALNRLRAHLHTRAGNAVDGRGPRVCGYGLNGAYAFSVATARECARVLKADIVHAEQALGHAWMAVGDVTYTFSIADVAANSPGDGGQIGNDITLHIHEPVCVELNRHSAGADPVRSCAWLTRAQLLNARWDDTLRGHINTAIGGDGSQHIDAAAANSVFVANNGAAVLDFAANTAVSLSYAIKVDYWPRGLGLAYFAADRPAGVVHNRLYDTTNGMHGGPNAEVVYINTLSGNTEANWAHVQGAVEAAVTAAGMARHQTNARTLYDVMVSTNAPDGDGAGHRAIPGGPSRVLNRLLLAQNGLPRSVHWGSAFVLVKVRATGSLGAAVHGVQSPVKEIGWIMGADNTGNGAGGHTEQRILEQLRLFVRALEAAVVHGTTLHVTDLSVRIITDWIPDFNHNSAFCYYDFKWTRLMAGVGYYRVAEYTDAIRTAQGVAGPNVPPTGAQANGNAANAAYPTRANLLARALAMYGGAGPVVAWSVTGDYLYAQANGAGNGQGQRQAEAFAEAGRNGRAIPNGADEAHGAAIGYGNAYELHAGGAFAQALA